MASCVEAVMKSLASLASAVSFLFTGCSFGLIPSMKPDKQFAITFARACALLCIFYYIAIFFYCAEYDKSPTEVYVFTTLIWITNIVTIAMIDGNFDSWLFYGIMPTMILFIIKISLSAHSVTTEILENGVQSTLIFWMCISDLLLLMFFSVIPFTLIHNNKKSKNVGFNIWALEYADCISHITVIMVYSQHLYAVHIGWDGTLIAYFVMFEFNLILWFIPSFFSVRQISMIRVHLILVDVLTDIPMIIITVVKQTYIKDTYIMVDLAVKTILLLRGLLYIPIKTWSWPDTFAQVLISKKDAGYEGIDDEERQ